MAPCSKAWSLVLGRLVSSSRNEFSVGKPSFIARRCFAPSHHSEPFSTSTSSSPPLSQLVGFVGLGAMGSRIAVNLSRAFPLVACDSSQAAVNAFIADAAASAASAENPPRHALASALSVPELFERAAELQEGRPPAAILTSLPSPAAVRDVWLGEKGLIRRAATAAAAAAAAASAPVSGAAAAAASASRGKGASEQGSSEKGGTVALIELSTIEPQTALELSAAVDKENETFSPSASSPPLLSFLSAPVSGGTAAAERGALTVLAGGPAPSLRAASLFLAPFSSRVLHAGTGPGDGDAAKLANNLALGIQMASVAEALALASRLAPRSLAPEKMLEVLNACSGRCWSSEAYPPLPELRDGYRGGFAASLMLKDLALAKEAARKSSSTFLSPSASPVDAPSPTPLGDAAAVAYRSCPGSEDFSSVFRHFYGEGKAVK